MSLPGAQAAGPRTVGLLVEFDGPEALRRAARRVRDAGFTHWDTHAPFPIHGIDEAMGIRYTRLPWIVFFAGLAGMLAALLLTGWANATNAATSESIRTGVPNFVQGYKFLVSGKPAMSLPAFIPIIFELTVLFAAIAAFLSMLVLNNLPLFSTPLLQNARFRRVTTDGFFLRIDATDPNYNARTTRTFLQSLAPAAVEDIEQRPTPPAPRRRIVRLCVTAFCLALIPPSVIAWARVSKKTVPRIHIIQDMDKQEKAKAQRPSKLFADGRAMRLPVAGSVARGELRDDDHYYRGMVLGQYAEEYPDHPDVKITEAFVRRGQRKFNIHCAPCHGLDGSGRGPVNERALELAEGAWVQAAALYEGDPLTRPVGHVFNTITNGIRTMPPYGDRIGETDRWAIVSYVRVLQRAHVGRLEDVPAEDRPELLRGDERSGLP